MNYFTTRLIKQLTIVLSFCLLPFSGVFGQTFQWVNQLEGSNDQFGQSTGTDASGNVYSAGYFFADIDLDPSVGTDVYTSNGQQDIYINKLDLSGNYLWGLTLGADLRDRCNDIFVDDAGNVYATGYFEDTVDFDPGTGQSLLTADGARDVYVLKLDPSGALLWAKRFGGTLDGEGVSIKANENSEVFVSGLFQGTYDFDPTSGSELLTAQGSRDAFVMKLNSDGNLNWVKQFRGLGNEYGMALDYTSTGELFISGFYSGTVDLDPSGSSQFFTSNGSFDLYAMKLSQTGGLVWARSFGGTAQERGEGVTVDNNDDFYISGRFQNTVNFDPGLTNTSLTAGGGLDGYLLKLDNNGNFQWVNHVESTANCITFRVVKGPAGNIYSTGYFGGSTNFISQSGTTNIVAGGGNDGFIHKVDPAGNEIWLYTQAGGGGSSPIDVHVSDDWSVYTTGFFDGTVDFDPSGSNTSLTSAAGVDAFIHKLSQTCVAPTITGTGALSTMLCPGVVDSTRVYIDGTLNDATEWAWYEGSCGGTYLGSGDSLTVRPTVNTTYYVRPEGACGTPVPCETVTVNVDNTPPVITLTTPITVNTDPGSCYYPSANLTAPTVTDADCGVDTVYNDADLLMLPGAHVVTWTAVDVNGNTSTETQDVTVQDIELPAITAPANLTVAADGSCQASGVALGTSTETDNCSVASVVNDAPATFPLGVTTVTWTVTDASGNINTDTQDVTVEDQTDPTIVGLPADFAVNTDPGVCEAAVNWAAPVANDNCPGAGIAQTAGIANGSNFPTGVHTIEYTATDAAGNTFSATFTVTVNDNENPTITAPADITVSADNSCQANPALGSTTTGDNCGVAMVSNDAPASFPLGSTIVTWTVTDINGNTNNDTQTINVIDDQDPVIVNLPANIVVSNDPGVCEAVVNWIEPTVSDNCIGATISQISGIANGGTFPVGVSTVEYEALDGSGNSVIGSFTVTVDDTENPTVTAPINVTVSADNNCQATGVALGAPTTNDNCGVASVTNDAPSIYSLGVTTVTWTVTDNSGNISTDTQDVTVVDDEDPAIIAPADITVSADGSCQGTVASLGTPVTSDNCSIISVTNDAPATYPLGSTIVTWTIEDGSGNISTDTQEIIVVDDTNPVIVGLPADISVSNDAGVCEAVVSWTAPTVSDNCTGATITLTSGIPNGDPFPVGVNTVEYTATDGSGNEIIETFTVTVTDNENPTIAAPADLNVNANNFCTAFGVVLGNAITSDNCTVWTVTNDGPAIYPLGTTVVTWTVSDSSGNMAMATQNVTVTDNQDPSVVAPANIDLTADNNCQATVSDLGSPISSDNCSVTSVTNDAPALFPLGLTIVTWTVTDGSGNTSTDTQEITVVDETDPTIVGLSADIAVSNDLGNCDAVVTWTAPTVNDNCSGATITQTAGAANGSAFPVGVSTIEYTATDGSGNEVTASFTITVTDDENPTIIAAADTLVEANNFCVAINIVLDAPAVTDNCTIASVDNDAPVIYPLGNTTVTWTVTDAAGNTAVATQIVTVADSTAPTIIAPLPVTAYVDDSCEVSGVDLGTPTFSDNCAVDTVYNNAPAIYTTGSYIVTWVAEDASGNVSLATQQVTIEDLILPTANLMDTTITLSPDGPIILFGSDIDLGSTDNCGLSEVVLMQESYDCDDLGTNQIAVEVIDVHGNILNTFITVTVVESGIDLDFDMIDDACDDDVNTTVVEVPSGFTPNGDGINDMFIIPGMSEYTSIRLTIFNRYGNRVYESEQYENDWDGTSSKNGKILPDGTYFYVLELDGGERYNGYVQINRTL
jgi:gliding motility-associated-like protein